MKITLVAIDINEKTLLQEMATPFGLLYISSYLKKHFDGDLEITIVDGATELQLDGVDMVGISSMSPFYGRACACATAIREKHGIPLILGGFHISVLPSTFAPCFDVGVVGEGEVTFLELLKLWKKKGRFLPGDLSSIEGIVFHDSHGNPVITAARQPIPRIDEIPCPDRSLWDMKNRAFHIVSSRGCPFRCVFCAIAGGTYRQASPAYVLKELEMLCAAYNPHNIIFLDDLFAAHTGRLREISEGIQALGLHKSVYFNVSLRVDNITEEAIALLAAMNVKSVFMGIESASPAMLRYYKSETVTLEDVDRAIRLCNAYDILVNSSFIIGAPRETPEDMYATFRFIVDHFTNKRIDGVAINLLTPYPTSRVWRYAKERGIIGDTMEWSRLAISLRDFDPYTHLYLNEVIPFIDFIDYVDMFEDLHYRTVTTNLRKVYKSFQDKIYRLDRERLARYKEEVKQGLLVPPGP